MAKNPNWGGVMPSPLYTKVAANIVREFKLSPMVQGAVQGKAAPGRITAVEAKKMATARRTPGIPVPHLHFKDQIYQLNAKQWKAFSTGLIAEFQVKMGKAKTVNFDQLQKISEAVGNLAK